MRHTSRKYVAVALLLCVAATQACGPNDVSKVKKKVADAAAILNTAAKSNRSLYQAGVYGPTGENESIQKRQRVAAAIHQANEYLSLAVERAAQLQPGDINVGKADIVNILQKAAQVLNSLSIDNENIKLVIASAVTAINTAITLTLAIKGVS